jgi:hypothetical protein
VQCACHCRIYNRLQKSITVVVLSDGNKFSSNYRDMRSFVHKYFKLKGKRKIRAYSGLLAREDRMEEFLLTWAKL